MPTANAEKAKLLLLENVNDSAVQLLQAAGFSTIERVPKALDGQALHKVLKGVSLLGIRRHDRRKAHLSGLKQRAVSGMPETGSFRNNIWTLLTLRGALRSQAFAPARAGRTLTGSRIAYRAGSGEEAQEISAACA
jgi:hypothetical protein